MAFVPNNIDEKKSEMYFDDNDDELDCIEESIVHLDGDKRQLITQSPHNNQDIIKCIGQLEVDYKYIKYGYETSSPSWATGTVFSTNQNKCFLLSAAHSVRKRIKECMKCMKYMDCIINEQVVVQCVHCNYNQLADKIIAATSILFRRREIIEEARVYDEKEKQTNVYKLGSNRKCYDCKCEYVNKKYNTYPIATSGYDYSILSFINNDNYNYSMYCKNIIISNQILLLKNNNIHNFKIFGYPISKKSNHYPMYGMKSTSTNYSVQMSKKSNLCYFKHKEIDTSGGQSGSAIWYNQNGVTIIFAIHSGGNNKKKYNVATIINDNILKNIKQCKYNQ
eukprot:455737_1